MMTRKRWLFSLPAMISLIAGTACGGVQPTASRLASDLPPITSTVQELQQRPISTDTASTLQTPVSTAEVAVGPKVIEAGNARQVVALVRLGKGTILSHPIYAPEGIPIYSPDGMWMTVPTSAGIYVYDARSLEEHHRIPVGTPFTAFSSDGSLLAASQRGAVSLWNPATGDRMGELAGDPEDHYTLGNPSFLVTQGKLLVKRSDCRSCALDSGSRSGCAVQF